MLKDPLYHSLFALKREVRELRPALAGSVLALCVIVSFGLWYFGLGSNSILQLSRHIRPASTQNRTMVRKRIIIPSLVNERVDLPPSAGRVGERSTVTVALGDASAVPSQMEKPEGDTPSLILGDGLTLEDEITASNATPHIKLCAIAWDENPYKSIAVLNDKILHEGDFLGEVRILRIKPDRVVLMQGNDHIIKRIHT